MDGTTTREVRDIEWAMRTLTRFEEIKAGYKFVPEGWDGWEVHALSCPADMTKVSADARCVSGAFEREFLTLADRVEIHELQREVDDLFGELMQSKTSLVTEASLPLPIFPGWLIEQLAKDVSDPVLRVFNEAREVLSGSRRWIHNRAAP